ncbi:MAG: hypothetical protein ACXWZX_14835, partial [Mycobacterium sp.]
MKRMGRVASLAMCVGFAIVGCSSSSESTTAGSETTTATSAPPSPSALKPIDLAAFQNVVQNLTRELGV